MIQFPGYNLTAPDGGIIGILAEGKVSLGGDAPRVGPGEVIPDVAGNLIVEHALAFADAIGKAQAMVKLQALRRAGAAIVLVSNDESLLETCADEIWWLRDQTVVARGDPAEVLGKYREHVAETLRRAGSGISPRLSPSLRKGDGRAVLETIGLTGEDGQPAIVWRSGELATVAIGVRFVEHVEDPVIGIMIRTRVGLNVYGTNTELEQVKFGPVEAGARIQAVFSFRCDLCPGQYTLTAASHDPSGLWHDWLEDAVAFSVSDSRYTAGVANLRATVEVKRD